MPLAARGWRKVGRRSSWNRGFPSFGLLYSLILLLLIPAGILVFAHAWGLDRHSLGLFVKLITTDSLRRQTAPYSETVFLSVDAKEQWNLNGKRMIPSEIPAALSKMSGGRTNCIVFLDVHQDLSYAVAIHAIDLIEGTGFKLVLLTPGTEKMQIP